MILKSLGFWGVSVVGFLAFGLVYQLVAGKWLRIRHHWLPLFWMVSWFNSRKEKNVGFHSFFSGIVTIVFWTPVILHLVLRTIGSHSPIAQEFGIWKVVGGSFATWLPFLAHKSASNLTALSFLVWWFWFHCVCTLLVHFNFPRVELVDGLKIGIDAEGRLVSKIRWEEMPFQSPVKPAFIFFKKPNPASRHTIPIAVRHGEVYNLNIAQETMWGFVGGTNSGKTSAVTGFCASIANVDEHTLFVFVDIIKSGSQYRVFECDPYLVHSAYKPERVLTAQWQRKQERLPNIVVIDNEETFMTFVNACEQEIDHRKRILSEHYGMQSLYDLEDPNKAKIDKQHRLNPPRLFRIVAVIDDWAVIRDEYKGTDIGEATAKLLTMVSFARFAKVHLLFVSQKATIADYFPGAARDQIFWMGFALPMNQSAYVLKKEVNLPNAMGVCGYIGTGTRSDVGIGATPYLPPLGGAMVFKKAAEKMIETEWGRQSMERMLAFKARCEADAGMEIMERCSQGQRELLKAHVLT